MQILKPIILFACAMTLILGFDFINDCKGCKNIEVIEQDGVYVFHIPSSGNYDVSPYVSEHLITNKEVFNTTSAELVINTGYFDTKNEETTSYVVINNNLALDPTLNKNLMQNEDLKPYLKQILNRTEFRVLDCNGEIKFDICAHNTRLPYKCKLKHSVQAGPLVYPELRLKREYFLKTKDHQVLRDSIQALQHRPRTVIGLKNNDIYIIIATLKRPLSLIEIQDICADLKLDKAMNFDGGGSTSLDYKGTSNNQYKNLHIVSEKNNTARKLKSFLIIK